MKGGTRRCLASHRRQSAAASRAVICPRRRWPNCCAPATTSRPRPRVSPLTCRLQRGEGVILRPAGCWWCAGRPASGCCGHRGPRLTSQWGEQTHAGQLQGEHPWGRTAAAVRHHSATSGTPQSQLHTGTRSGEPRGLCCVQAPYLRIPPAHSRLGTTTRSPTSSILAWCRPRAHRGSTDIVEHRLVAFHTDAHCDRGRCPAITAPPVCTLRLAGPRPAIAGGCCSPVSRHLPCGQQAHQWRLCCRRRGHRGHRCLVHPVRQVVEHPRHLRMPQPRSTSSPPAVMKRAWTTTIGSAPNG